jgi:CheY-like chemotaxis protein
MMKNEKVNSYRILVCDDREEITSTFHDLLTDDSKDIGLNELKDLASTLFEQVPQFQNKISESTYKAKVKLRVDTANQGLEAIEMFKEAIEEEDPYAVAVLDMRMPPGISGFETAIELVNIDENIELCFCTAYSDITISEISETLGEGRFLLLKKPVNPDELVTTVEFLSKTSTKQKYSL